MVGAYIFFDCKYCFRPQKDVCNAIADCLPGCLRADKTSRVMALCTASQFQSLTLFGASALSFNTHSHTNLSFNVAAEQNHYAKNVTGLNVYEVVITYMHPGYNDEVNTLAWLPKAEEWSGRFLGAGGGGWVTGAENSTFAWAASEGFAFATTDGGHAADSLVQDWALLRPGNVN